MTNQYMMAQELATPAVIVTLQKKGNGDGSSFKAFYNDPASGRRKVRSGTFQPDSSAQVCVDFVRALIRNGQAYTSVPE